MVRSLLLVALAFLACSVSASAQPREGRLQITVVDQTGGVLPGASVTVGRLETTSGDLAQAQTTAQGIAIFEHLAPGRYAIKAEFPGFETGVNLNVTVRSGDNRQTLALAIQKIADSVTVQRDKQDAALDRSTTFGSALTREQIDALSEDPDVLRQQLQDMAGGPAIIRVDSFEGAPLPPKAQIKSIHITRDGFAAENHNAGAFFIDIVTQPGIGPLRGTAQYAMRPGTLTGTSPFTPVKGPEQLQFGAFNIGGTLVPEKSSFSLNLSGSTQYTTPNLNVVTPAGAVAHALDVRAPRDSINVQGLLDYTVTRDQTLRIGFNVLHNAASNVGIGAYDEPGRAYGTTDSTANVRMQLAGPFKRRMFTNTRLNLTHMQNDQSSVLEAPTIQVLDAFTSGGAQMAGARSANWLTFASDIDYVRGHHSVRAGVLIDGGSWTSTLNSNYLGTYIFPSLAAYDAGTPSNYTRRIGNPTISYTTLDAGVYLQDDMRLRRSLTISPGIRYEVQQHLSDWRDLGPRIGLTWAPFSSGKTAVRASAGVFYDFLPQATLEQVLRVDGTHEQELNLVNPSFPNPGVSGAIPPANRYFLDPALQSPRNTRLSTGLEQTFRQSPTFTVRGNVLYAYTRTEHAWRGLNDNAPVDGVRPDSGFANVVDVVSDASARQHQLTVGWNIGLPPQPPGNEIPKFFLWKRFAVYGQEVMTIAHNNTDGDFMLSPSGSLADQWGRSVLDIPSRLTFNIISLQVRRTQIQASLTQQSGVPFTETTGFDPNGDGVFNERPVGALRNTLRGADQWNLSMYGQYTISMRRRATPLTGIVATQFTGGTVSNVGTFADATRYRIFLVVQAQNLTNHNNYNGYSGVLTSPFFDQPTAVVNPRRVLFNIAFSF
ncbi:MAG TPA: TonB-dependent receptor [Vicinamibacterales bacterium]|nr:TonB-dependent receptor [Vicinamibacterales bacterium]